MYSQLTTPAPGNFPSCLEGLSLRPEGARLGRTLRTAFPFLFGRAFIEAGQKAHCLYVTSDFPFFMEGFH